MEKNLKDLIVISGISLFQGGALSVYKDFLHSIYENGYCEKYEIICFIHNRNDFLDIEKYFTFIELPKARRNYFCRLYYEYIYFYNWSRVRKVKKWISLHDITPHVVADEQYVYCHNPSPFYKNNLQTFRFSKSLFFMAAFYKYLYAINIKKNKFVIVQQNWLRDKFAELYKIKNIIVARPNLTDNPLNASTKNIGFNKMIYVYPSLPRVFKNFEVLLEAAKIAEKQCKDFEIWITIDGTENKYASYLKSKYKDISSVKWLGLLSRSEVENIYADSHALIFPSALETWGLPITEYKKYRKPIILADLPYAHETIGTYDLVRFFSPDNPTELAKIILEHVRKKVIYESTQESEVDPPFAADWNELCKIIF